MMAELAAVGLAGNILSFIDFAFKLLTTTRTIYRSSSDKTSEYYSLDIIARDVKYHCDKLDQSSLDSSHLSAITKESRQIAQALQARIQKIRDKAGGSKWGSFTVALRGVMVGDEVAALMERLSKVNKQISAHLLQSMLAQQQQLITKFDGMESFLAMIQEDLKRAADVTKKREDEITDKLGRYFKALNNGRTDITQGTAKLSPNYNAFSPSVDSQSDFISFYALENDKGKMISHYRAIKTLEFKEMWSREEHIEIAHTDTFGWILDESRDDIGFVRWLEDDNSTYWIHGKLGAGKSTLMKYICAQSKTYEHLERWAQGKSLITARFFSSSAGTDLQKSLEGLLRSLLFDIFTKRPLLIGELKLLENDAVKRALGSGSYSISILKSLLQRLIEQTPTMSYCFFIDGLDSFVDHHDDLNSTVQSLAKHKNLKLCVSSRSLCQFNDEYGGKNQLKVESLTQGDIQSFVTDKLSAKIQLQEELQEDPRYRTLMAHPVDKSSGVFLWVASIVRSLGEGLTYADSLQGLEKRLTEFPDELTDSLMHAIRSVGERYQKESAEAFRIALVHEDAIPLVLFSALFDMESNPERYTLSRQKPYTKDKILKVRKDTRRKLDARCKGLLEVVGLEQGPESDPIGTVRWLHLCVKEFFKSSEDIEEYIVKEIRAKPNAGLLICGAYLGVTKWLPKEDSTMSNPFDQMVFRPFCAIADQLYRAKPDPLGVCATEDDARILHVIILALEKTLQERWPGYSATFTYRALDLGWRDYIEYRMKTGSEGLDQIMGQLLEYTLGSKDRDQNLDVMETLLHYGANPNEQLRAGKTQTPWTTALMKYMWEKEENKKNPADRKRPQDHNVHKTAEALQLLAKHGADPDAHIPIRKYPPRTETETTAREIVENHTEYPELRDIKLKSTEIPEPPDDFDLSDWLLGWLDWLRSWKDWVIGIKTKTE